MANAPHHTASNITLTVLALASGSCLISLMALFMGGGNAGTDLRGLLFLQAAITPIALVIGVVGISKFTLRDGWSKGVRTAWRAIPQWLVFIFLIVNSLVMLGEVAYVLVMRATDEIVMWHEHVPLACLFASSSAYLVLYARINSYPGSPPAMSGRWT